MKTVCKNSVDVFIVWILMMFSSHAHADTFVLNELVTINNTNSTYNGCLALIVEGPIAMKGCIKYYKVRLETACRPREFEDGVVLVESGHLQHLVEKGK